MAKQAALIRFYYKCDPYKLSDAKFALYFEEIMFVLKYNGTITTKA